MTSQTRQDPTPKTSVITTFLDEERFLAAAIESVLQQTWDCWELLLIDDGSEDGSTELARKAARRHPGQIRYLEHPGHANLGTSASRNLGLRNSVGTFVAFLDGDDVYLPQKLEKQVPLLERQPDVGWVFGATEWWFSWSGNDEDKARDFVSSPSHRSTTLYSPPDLQVALLKKEVYAPCMGSLLVRREALQSVGGFEEEFPGMYDDQVLYSKLALSFTAEVNHDCLDRYRQHDDSCFNTARLEGSVAEARRHYIRWIADYLSQIDITSPDLWKALQREQWLQKHPALDRMYRRYWQFRRRLSSR